MHATTILIVIFSYFLVLVLISFLTSKKNDNSSFFMANKQSPWYIVAFGMIGASLSGVTFISVPGWVESSHFSYLQMALGYLLGYIIVANILLPLYYRLNLISIYTYLDQRFGKITYKTGASFFILSRVIGASFRLFLVASVMQFTVFDYWNIPFFVTVIITILLIWIYTFRGGLNTIIWTDTLQTFFMLLAVIITVIYIAKEMNLDAYSLYQTIHKSEYSQIFYFDDWKSPQYFWKQLISGMFITIVMTGLDQDMMQKNLTCKNIKEAQKNMYWFSFILLPVNLVFLGLGAMLYLYAYQNGVNIPERADLLYAEITTNSGLPVSLGIIFIIGLIASAYSSADSALASLTTSYSIDIINIEEKYSPQEQIKKRKLIHIGFSIILAITIIIFNLIGNESVIKLLIQAASYTYGPLLGLYAFGLFTKYKIKDALSLYILISAPILTFGIKYLAIILNSSYQFGFELLIINGILSFAGLYFIKEK